MMAIVSSWAIGMIITIIYINQLMAADDIHCEMQTYNDDVDNCHHTRIVGVYIIISFTILILLNIQVTMTRKCHNYRPHTEHRQHG